MTPTYRRAANAIDFHSHLPTCRPKAHPAQRFTPTTIDPLNGSPSPSLDDPPTTPTPEQQPKPHPARHRPTSPTSPPSKPLYQSFTIAHSPSLSTTLSTYPQHTLICMYCG